MLEWRLRASAQSDRSSGTSRIAQHGSLTPPRMAVLAGLAVVLCSASVSALQSLRAPAAAPAPRSVAHRIARGESFSRILAAHGAAPDEGARWHRALRTHFDLRHIQAGRILHFELAPDGRLRGLRYEIARDRTLLASRGGDGDIEARVESQPVDVRVVGARATVRTSFYEAARRAGVPSAIISRMVDLLSWKLSLNSDVHRGDRLRVLYEVRIGRDGRRLAPGRVLAVDYRGRTESVAAYLYAEADGEPVYADDAGHLLDAAPLRFPLEFTRISSTFSDARMHPILKRERAHLGVDFAAPIGTPVRAIAPGLVKFAGAQNGFGNHVELDHGAERVSAYSHLNGIAPGVKSGARVQRGQLLGWVGQTGLATGPHLHFAVFEGGRYVDPLTLEFPADAMALDPRRYARLRTEMLARLRAIPRPAPETPNAPESLPPLAQAGRIAPITLTF
jgi:murein DD-endopeptidase MepM/ murein hydrolase activator NlpD